MNDQPGENYKNGSGYESPKICGEYTFDKSNGLYLRKSDSRDDDGDKGTNGTTPKSPFHVKVCPDWIVIGVSILTLFGLAATVYFTRHQWQTMNDTYVEIQNQTKLQRQHAI